MAGGVVVELVVAVRWIERCSGSQGHGVYARIALLGCWDAGRLRAWERVEAIASCVMRNRAGGLGSGVWDW
jgi:hypothetical protein